MAEILITKANGQQEPFVESKLRESLERAGAHEEAIKDIVRHIEAELSDGMTTAAIYRHAFALLKQRERPAAARYSLKRAVLDLGPTGFPFEEFIAEIFRAKGFDTKTQQTLEGACGRHEVDVLATKATRRIGCEAKFHNAPGLKSDMKVALYVRARFDDLEGHTDINEPWLVTNTKFTGDAIEYGTCAGLTLVGWSYPRTGNLQDLIEETKVHPVTALTTIPKRVKKQLLEKKVVLCKTIQHDDTALRAAGLPSKVIDAVMQESQTLCKP